MEKGEAEKGKGETWETLKNKQKMPFLGGKQGFLSKTKKGKEKQK